MTIAFRAAALGLVLFSTAPALAQQAAPKAADADVVVTGTRLKDSERELRECIARKCPPKEDIRASLKHAENLFVAGQYRQASRILTAARGRDKRFAKDYPVEVSELLRANARVSAHLGEREEFQIGTLETLSALKAGLPATDWRVLAARIELGDMYAKLGRPDAAEEVYNAVASKGNELNLPRVEGLARLRLANLYTSLSKTDGANYSAEAVRAVDRLLQDTRPEIKPYAQAARVLRAEFLAKRGDSAALDTLIAELRAQPAGSRPVLIYAPPIAPLRDVARGASVTSRGDDSRGSGNAFALGGVQTNALTVLPSRLYDDQWIDIGFYVKADGRVSDAAVIRSSKQLEAEDWAKLIITSISGRRYLPLQIEPDSPGVFRVERYTLTSWYQYNTGSRIAQRGPQPNIEMIDLSVDGPQVAAKTK